MSLTETERQTTAVASFQGPSTVFAGQPQFPSSVFFFWKRIFCDKWHWFIMVRKPFLSTNQLAVLQRLKEQLRAPS